MTLDYLLPIPEASARLKISELHLRVLLQSGKIRGGILTNGKVVVNEQDARARTPKEELPEYKKHAHLKGQTIWISEASRRYEISNVTILNWVKRGIIKRLGTEKNKVLLDEQDVAYCVDVYRTHGGKQGRWLFNLDGTPYIPQTGTLAR